MFIFTQSQSARVNTQAHRQWSLAIQQETRQVLMAKRPISLPKDLAKTEIYFKNLRGEVAVMTLYDYMSNVLCLSVMAVYANIIRLICCWLMVGCCVSFLIYKGMITPKASCLCKAYSR